jgi:hypothetical protein
MLPAIIVISKSLIYSPSFLDSYVVFWLNIGKSSEVPLQKATSYSLSKMPYP